MGTGGSCHLIIATQEAEIRRLTVRSQPGQIVHETLSRKTLHKNRDGGVAQGEGSEFKPQYSKIIIIIINERNCHSHPNSHHVIQAGPSTK
jgi:hypothetical protein